MGEVYFFGEDSKRTVGKADANLPVDDLQVRVRVGDGSRRANLSRASMCIGSCHFTHLGEVYFFGEDSKRTVGKADANLPVDDLQVRVRVGDGSRRANLSRASMCIGSCHFTHLGEVYFFGEDSKRTVGKADANLPEGRSTFTF